MAGTGQKRPRAHPNAEGPVGLHSALEYPSDSALDEALDVECPPADAWEPPPEFADCAWTSDVIEGLEIKSTPLLPSHARFAILLDDSVAPESPESFVQPSPPLPPAHGMPTPPSNCNAGPVVRAVAYAGDAVRAPSSGAPHSADGVRVAG